MRSHSPSVSASNGSAVTRPSEQEQHRRRAALTVMRPVPPVRRPLADLAEIADYLGDTHRHIRKLVFERAIPVTRVGGKLRFDLDVIDHWLAEHTEPPATPQHPSMHRW